MSKNVIEIKIREASGTNSKQKFLGKAQEKRPKKKVRRLKKRGRGYSEISPYAGSPYF